MKTIILFLALSLFFPGVVLADGQEERFTFNFRDRSITEILSAVEAGSGYAFLFPGQVEVMLRERVNLHVEAVTIDELLTRLFLSTGLVYTIVDRQVLVTRTDSPARADTTRVVVTGQVVDEEGLPLAGATIRVKETSTGVATNREGVFSLTLTGDKAATLVVSFVGMETREIPLTPGVTRYDVALVPSETTLGEVVAFGYFYRRNDNFTGSAITVSGEELKRVNANNLVRAIEAFDPSFKVLQDNLSGSDPNKMPNINVRGTSSVPTGAGEVLRRDNINSSVNLPTFILDGYEVGVEKIHDLDMNRVASISLLKDAAATAIYGSRAANGVLVITTIAPAGGKQRVSYHYELTPSFPDLSSYDVLDAAEKLEYERLAGVYETEGVSLDEQQELYYRKLYNVLSGVNTYWLASPVKNAFGHKHSLFIEGGSPVVRYGISAQYQSMPGVMKRSSRDRLGMDVELSYNMNRVILFKNTLSVASVNGNDSPHGSFAEYVRVNPYYPRSDERGRVIREIDTWRDRGGAGGGIRDNVVLNPLHDASLGSFSKSGYLEISELFTAEWNIIPGLRLRGLLGFTRKNTSGDNFVSPDANEFYFYGFEDLAKRGRYTYNDAKEWHVDGSATLTWSGDAGDHFFHLAAGTNIRAGETRTKSFTAIGFTNDRFTDIG
ncbi:MAG: carboxypeptidase-like regulatory domain-containing protein [Odoribacteraceae bacterium]|jgi:TonB-dependent SusC/RagA subfamily outer membrane receptor|nr:carboxypeptidase-like regulatory domain-containing protein [Odoribacteraceae bacterium]